MPYIGRNHLAGDHTSNFKVLDDISSYTATFNGSLATIISTADNTIRIPEHRFVQGQRVTYSNGGGGNIGGLTNGTAYFVTFDTANTFKLATSLANANNNTNINLSSVGTGSAHTLTAAFDGVNTTFKITHNGGSSANIVNSAQLQIAINNVIQKANLDSSYTEGFLVVDNRKIQFKTAPTADDIFWGNIIANTIETFDIADLKIDQFTGDGTTTQFTLSREVPNNQSVMVTLDGVVQHPSDKDTTRAYRILADTVIEFSSPPGLSIEIQVRHLGFAGASTGDVTGFYGRTGNVVLGASDHITTGDITPRNINASGIVTASSFVGNLTGNVSGNLTVGGVLTYEDVTNVDSIGIITARSDIHVGAGVSAVGVGTFGSLDIGGDIDVDGHTNLDNLSVAGVTTMTGALTISSTTDQMLNLNSSDNNGTSLAFQRNGSRQGYIGYGGGSSGLIIANEVSNGAVAIQGNDGGSIINMLSFASDNKGLATIHGGATIPLDLDVDGHTNLDNVSIAGVTTIAQDLDVDGHTELDNVNISGMTTVHQLKLIDNRYLQIGSNNDIQLYHDTNNSYINASNSAGSLFITGPSAGIKLQSDDNRLLDAAGNVIIKTDANSANLYYNGSVRMQTSSVGITVNNDLDVDGHTNLDNVSIAGVVTATSFSGDGSNLTGITQTTINSNVNNYLITGTGTANTLQGEGTLTYDGTSIFELQPSSATPARFIGDANRTGQGQHLAQFEGNWNGTLVGRMVVVAGEDTSNKDDGHLDFYTTPSGGSNTRRLRIDSSGNIGEGTATPITPDGSNADNPNNGRVFTIYGDSPAINLIHNTAGGGSAGSTDYAAINFGRNGSSSNPYRAVIGYKQVEDILHINANNHIVFDTGGNINTGERLRITSSGNVLIGDGSTYTPGCHVHLHGGTSGLQQLRVQNHTSIGSFSGNYGSEFRHAFSSANHCMLIHTQEAATSRRTLDISDSNGVFASFTNHRMGLGTGITSPNATLDIRTTNDDDAIRLVNTSTGNNGIQWWNEYGGLTKRVSMDYGEGDANFDIKLFRADAQDDRPYGNVRIFTGDYANPNMNFRVTTLGTVHQPNQPAFLVRDSVSGSAFGANSYADFDTVILNRGNHYNTSNGRFTAPISGTYLFLSLMLSNGSSRLFHEIRKNGSRIEGTRTESGTTAGQYQSNTTQAIVELAKGDWVAIHVGSGGAYGSAFSNFSGYLLG